MDSIFDSLRTIQDYQRQEQEFQVKKQLLQAQAQKAAFEATPEGRVSQLPAAMQLADAYQKARASGDTLRMNDLEQFSKIFDRGIVTSPQGAYVSAPGYDQALAFRRGLGREAEKSVDLNMNPRIARAEADQKNISNLNYDPQIEAAKTEANITSKAKAEATRDLPKVGDQAQQALDLIQSIGSDPGLSAVVGAPNPLKGRIPFIGNVMGTPAADFQAKLDQLGGKQFLEAFESLKGGGQITEVEGAKATNAIGRMQTSQSEEAFRKALGELQDVIKKGAERTKARAAGKEYVPTESSTGSEINTGVNKAPPKAGEVRGKYLFIGGNPNDKNNWKLK